MAHSPFDLSMIGTVAIGQIANLSHSPNVAVVPGFGSGDVNPSAMYQGDSAHSSTFQSTQLATILALNSSTFLNVGIYYTSASSIIPFRKRVSGGKYATGGSHAAISAAKAFLIPQSLSAQGATPATIDCEIKYASSDGKASPITALTGQTLSAAAYTSEFQLAKATINGTAIPELTGASITAGLTILEQKVDGGVFPTAFYISRALPVVDFTCEDAEAALAAINAASIGSGFELYLAKKLYGAICEDFANTVHIKISGANGMRQTTQLGGAAEAISGSTIRVNPFSLTTAVGVAIP